MENTFKGLHQHINEIKDRELLELDMTNYIEKQVSNLHRAVCIDTVEPVDAFFNFTIAYIDSAYDYLDAIHSLAVESETTDYLKPFINLAFMFFTKPPELLLRYQGGQRLLYQAYLSNRLLEELNDQITNLIGVPLSPMDTSMDNIICHALIGDELANQLDHLVFLTLETTPSDKSVFKQPQTLKYLEQIRADDWRQVRRRWPCFTNDLSALLSIAGS
jgi:hypothetical protein